MHRGRKLLRELLMEFAKDRGYGKDLKDGKKGGEE
jgi:hypothetical protein